MNVLGWSLEWLTTLARRRLLVLNLSIPLLLVLPIAGAGAPSHHAAAVYAVLYALFGTFGAAIPLLRDAERGFIRRIALTRARPAGFLTGRALAGTCIDALQLIPATILVLLLSNGVSPIPLFAAILAALLVANLVGVWIAALARSVAEGALFCAVTALLLLHASGTFRTPPPDGIAARIEAIAPFRALHEQWLASLGGTAPSGHTAALLAGAILLLATMATSRALLRMLARADGRG